MDPIFRPDLTRIVLTGSESTGKTTLAAQLAAHYGCEFVPEFVREFAEKKGAPIALTDHGPIAHGQIALENEYAARAGKLLIQDADLLSTVAYCHHYFGTCPQWIEEAARERRATLYVLCNLDVPWEADGIRDRGKQRFEMHALFKLTLRRLATNFRELMGTGPARFANAVSFIDAAISSPRS